MPNRYERDGLRLCTGGAHEEGGEWLPATKKYFYVHRQGRRAGNLYSRCRLCVNWHKLKSPGPTGWVSVEKAWPYAYELVGRLGFSEAVRRCGISPGTMRKIINKSELKVQKRTLRKIMLQVISCRRNREVRHKKSIWHGSYIRGREERRPVRNSDFYHRLRNESSEDRVERANR